MHRRQALKALGGAGATAALAQLLTACGSQDEGGTGGGGGSGGGLDATVAFALFPGYLDAFKQYVFDPYVADNGGVTIEPLEGPASKTFAQLLASPPDNRSIQGGLMNDALGWSGVERGLWEASTPAQVPNLASVPEPLRTDAGTPWVFNFFGVSYNPEKLPDGIRSWTDLYSPSLKGRVAMWPAYFDAYIMAAVAAGADEHEIEKGIEAWEPAKDNIGLWISSVAEMHQAMDAGEIWAAPDYGSTTIRDAAKGMNLALSIPEEGATLLTYLLEVVSGIDDDQRTVMHALLDTALSEEMQRAVFETHFLTPANAEVTVDAGAVQVPGLDYDFTAQTAADRFYQVDYRYVGENTADIKKLIEDRLM